MVRLYKIVKGSWVLVNFGVRGINYNNYLVIVGRSKDDRIGDKLIKRVKEDVYNDYR